MKKLIDVPDEHIEGLKKMAKAKHQSVKAYMESAVIALLLNDSINLKTKRK